MRIHNVILVLAGAALLCGCRTVESPATTAETSETMLHLDAGLQPEILLFPEYLLMVDFEIDQHGRIPGSSVIGAGLKTSLDIEGVRERFLKVLEAHEWGVIGQEQGDRTFRLQAVRDVATLEVRAVQGTGASQVFLLYQPGPGPLL